MEKVYLIQLQKKNGEKATIQEPIVVMPMDLDAFVREHRCTGEVMLVSGVELYTPKDDNE